MATTRSLILALTLLIVACVPQSPATPAGPSQGVTQPNEQRDSAQVLRIASQQWVGHLGPDGPTGAFYFQWPLYDQLVQFGQNYELRPSLARTWELTADRKSWKFTIRNDVTFSNGDKLTAEDVAFTINTALKDSWPQKGNLANVTGATAVDATTVNVALSQVDSSIPNALTYLWIIPKKYFESIGAQEFRAKPIGSGPYELVEIKEGDQIRFRKRSTPHAFREVANNEIIYLNIPDNTQRINGLITGDLDIVAQSSFSGEQADRLKQSGMDVRTQRTAALIFGMPKGTYESRNTPLADVRVRQALNYAINRDQMNQAVYKGFAVPLGQPAIPGSLYHDDSVKAWPYDPAKAKQLLAEAGYPNGFKLTIDWATGSGPQELILGIQAAFKDIGVEAEIKAVETGQLAAYHFGQNNLVKDDLFPLNAFDPTGYGPRTTFVCGGPVGAPAVAQYYCNPAHDALVSQALAEADSVKAKQLMAQAGRMASNDAPALFLFAYPNFIAATPKIRSMTLAAPHLYNFDSAYKVR